MMYLFDDIDNIKTRINGAVMFLFLDFDGTLAPIVDLPSNAVLSEENRKLLILLSETEKCRLAIISGRELKDIKKRIGIANISYAGNHGFEIESPDFKYTIPLYDEYRSVVCKLKKEIENCIPEKKGIWIEDKNFTLSVHYRAVDKFDIDSVKKYIKDITAHYAANNLITVKEGKKVIEIHPPVKWNKGEVVLYLIEKWVAESAHSECIPIYVGDDVSDEDAFKEIKNFGLTVYIGNPTLTNAQYYLNNTDEVSKLLKEFLKLMRN